ncbi:hypothetical protein BN975_02210 [Mycolicibacterium farcinogenes]|nr:hypothetical protein BN975_02210 [Mycolicibacterium farcinogenes]
MLVADVALAEHRGHRTAAGVSAHHDRGHVELVHGERDGGFDRLVDLARRDDVADVANGEQVTRAATGDDVGHHPRVGAGQEQCFRILAIGQVLHVRTQHRGGAPVVGGQPVQHRRGVLRLPGTPRHHTRTLVERGEVADRRSQHRTVHLDGAQIVQLDIVARGPVLTAPVLDGLMGGVVDEIDGQFHRGVGVGGHGGQSLGQLGQRQERAGALDGDQPIVLAGRLGVNLGAHHSPHRQRDRQRQADRHTLEQVEEYHAHDGDQVNRQIAGELCGFDVRAVDQPQADHDEQAGKSGGGDHLSQAGEGDGECQHPHAVQDRGGAGAGTGGHVG